jgi:hypothetical protein
MTYRGISQDIAKTHNRQKNQISLSTVIACRGPRSSARRQTPWRGVTVAVAAQLSQITMISSR